MTKARSSLARFIAGIAVLFVFADCSRATGGARRPTTVPHTLRIGVVENITTLNPHLMTSIALADLSELTMAYLVRYGHDNRPLPELATIVPSKRNKLISADGRTIIWHLRHGVKWSDGAPFDADDVVFSTNVVNDPRNAEVGRAGYDLIGRIDEPDKFTVIYHLKRPYSGFLPTFFGSAGANPCLLPKHLLGRLGSINNADYNMKPVGIGPFRYVRWLRGDRVELEANPYYWRGRPKLTTIVYKFVPDSNTLFAQIRTGEIDLWPRVGLGLFDRVKALSDVKTIDRPGDIFAHIDFNRAQPVLADRAVRSALRSALDRATILRKIEHGLGVVEEGPISPTSPLFTALPAVPFDLRRAAAELDAGGWKRGVDGVRRKGAQRLAFRVAVTTGHPDLDAAIELARSTWQQIGAQITVQHFPFALMFAPLDQGGIVYAGKFDAALFAWQVTPDGDLSDLYGCDQLPPNGQNDVRYCDATAQAAFDAAKRTYDERRRRPFIAAAERQIIRDIPTVVLWVENDTYAYSADLRGWRPNSTTPFDDLLDVDI